METKKFVNFFPVGQTISSRPQEYIQDKRSTYARGLKREMVLQTMTYMHEADVKL